MSRVILKAAAIAAVFALSGGVAAVLTSALASDEVFVNDQGVAIRGYDPVSYFKGAGLPGKPEFASKHQGATYYFASAENKVTFEANPAAYTPQFGGYCALGTAYGGKFRTDPSTGKVVDGKLYFNKNPDVAKSWSKDIPGYIAKANSKWPKVIGKSIDGG